VAQAKFNETLLANEYSDCQKSQRARTKSRTVKLVSVFTSTFRDYARFSGRSDRSTYWIWQFEIGAVWLWLYSQNQLFLNFFVAVIFVPTLSLAWRRAHDSGKPGWIMLIPFLREFIALIPGNVGLNKFGPPSPPIGR
jgi:uncharacterized membrane protein YhaH (DUF805 family)